MPDNAELDRLYAEAKSALKKREYDRATGLLTQILVIDESYKDVPRLLAQTVNLKRRRWYNHPTLWGTLGLALLIGLGIGLLKILPRPNTNLPVEATVTPSMTVIPATATITLTPTATPIPLTWKRISMGQDFQRDTVTAFATDKKDPDVIYAAMKNAGVYKTIDGGLSWRPAHQGLESTQVESLLIDSQTPQILYAGTMGGIFKTEDGGENWFRVGEGIYLLMDLQNNSHLYARDENGIYESIDQGNTWTTVYVLKKNCPDVVSSWAIHPTNGNMLFIGGGETCAGVYQSSDKGQTWKLIGLEDKPNVNNLVIGLDELGNFSIYASLPYIYSPLVENGLFVTHDGGANWSQKDEWGCYGTLVIADLDNPSDIYCDMSVLRGGDGPWQAIPNTQSKNYSAIHIDHPNGTERIITSATDVSRQRTPNVGIFISTNGGVSWSERNDGLGTARAELKIDPLNNTRVYLASYYVDTVRGTGCSLHLSLDGGKSWTIIVDQGWMPPTWCGPAFDAANVMHLMVRGSLQKSWNGGETWLWDNRTGLNWQQRLAEEAKNIANRLPSYNKGGSQSVSANPYVNGLAYAVGDVIYYSTDAGVSWQLSAGSKGSWDGRLFYTDQSKMIYAIGRTHQAYSVDNGKTWQNCGQDVTASRSDTRLALDLQGSRLYLATPGQGVMISTDSCGSWQPSNNGLTNLFANTLAIDPDNPNIVYAGTDGGAYISYDSGATWGQVNDGLLGAVVVYSIAVDKESNVYAATPYGVFKLENK